MSESKELSLVISNPEQGKFLKHIDWNRDEFMTLVQSAMKRYDGVTFTEDQVKEAKEERARLNALKKAISDRRIQIKNEVMAPYAQFESEVREVVALIDGPIAEIDRQIKTYEDTQKEAKKDALRQYFTEAAAGLEEIITFEKIFDRRYLNVSVTLAKAKKDIADKVERVRAELKTVESVEEEYRPIVRDVYGKTLDIGRAMGEMYRLKDLKHQEEERKMREAAEREAATAREAETKEMLSGKPQTVAGERPESGPAVSERDRSPETVRDNKENTPPATAAGPAHSGAVQDAPSAQDPFINPPKEKQYKASFTVYGTRNQILSVRQFLLDHGIRFEKGVK